jgi:hypothetical protein
MMRKTNAISNSVSRTPAKKAKIKLLFRQRKGTDEQLGLLKLSLKAKCHFLHLWVSPWNSSHTGWWTFTPHALVNILLLNYSAFKASVRAIAHSLPCPQNIHVYPVPIFQHTVPAEGFTDLLKYWGILS